MAAAHGPGVGQKIGMTSRLCCCTTTMAIPRPQRRGSGRCSPTRSALSAHSWWISKATSRMGTRREPRVRRPDHAGPSRPRPDHRGRGCPAGCRSVHSTAFGLTQRRNAVEFRFKQRQLVRPPRDEATEAFPDRDCRIHLPNRRCRHSAGDQPKRLGDMTFQSVSGYPPADRAGASRSAAAHHAPGGTAARRPNQAHHVRLLHFRAAILLGVPLDGDAGGSTVHATASLNSSWPTLLP